MCKGFYGRAINLVMGVGKSAQFALILDALRCRNGESNGMDEDHYDAGLSTTFPYLRHDLYYEDTEDMPNFQTDPFGNNSRQLSKLKQQIVIFTSRAAAESQDGVGGGGGGGGGDVLLF